MRKKKQTHTRDPRIGKSRRFESRTEDRNMRGRKALWDVIQRSLSYREHKDAFLSNRCSVQGIRCHSEIP